MAGVAAAEAALGWTLDYVKRAHRVRLSRSASFQNTPVRARRDAHRDRHRARCSSTAASRRSTPASSRVEEAAEAKWWCTELQKRTVDRCVQLHGGYGYMLEYPIARAYVDARVTTIYGGTTEIMKEIIGRKMTRG